MMLQIKLALIGRAVSEKKIFENGGRRMDRRRLDGYTISPPWEPNGSGELKRGKIKSDVLCSLDWVKC